jgi:LuxR family maltose regulon positive regulatory protein
MGGDITREIEVLILQALAFQSGDDRDQALASLEKALDLGEPRGFCRIFVDEGESMAKLLYEALSCGIKTNYIQRLLAAFSLEGIYRFNQLKPRDNDEEWVEPLSEREIEVLNLIEEGLTNQQIASRLFSLYIP